MNYHFEIFLKISSKNKANPNHRKKIHNHQKLLMTFSKPLIPQAITHV